MKARVVICDVYGTLMQVDPGPSDADAHWGALCRRTFGREAFRSWTEHQAALRSEVTRTRTFAQERGVPVPEVVWEEVVAVVEPESQQLSEDRRREFLVAQAGLTHVVRAFPGVGACLTRLKAEGVLLGIASNAQAYSEAELDRELAMEGVTRALFEPELCFWSWRHGFSKPDPHVFRCLDVRVRGLGIRSEEVLMVGDRLDNDIAPARAWGWQAWQLMREGGVGLAGDWRAFEAWWWG